MKQYEKDYVVACVEDKFDSLEISAIKCMGDKVIIHYAFSRILYEFSSLNVELNHDLEGLCYDIVIKIMTEVRGAI